MIYLIILLLIVHCIFPVEIGLLIIILSLAVFFTVLAWTSILISIVFFFVFITGLIIIFSYFCCLDLNYTIKINKNVLLYTVFFLVETQRLRFNQYINFYAVRILVFNNYMYIFLLRLLSIVLFLGLYILFCYSKKTITLILF